MNDPDLELLLQRARSTAPRAGSKGRLRARILSGAAAAGVVAVTAEAAGAAKASTLLAAVGKSGSGLWLSVLACVAGGVATGLWVIGPAVTTAGPSSSPQTPPVTVGTAASAFSRSPAPDATAQPIAYAELATPPRAPALPLPSAAAESLVPSIERETALLAEAQRALRQSDAAAALRVLDRYDVEFPRGALAEEASAARSVSWCSLGRKEEGLRALAKFRATYPSSPLSPRVTAACSNLGRHDDFELESASPTTQSGKGSAPASPTGR